MVRRFIPKSTLQRLPLYLAYIKTMPPDVRYISATAVAEGLGYNHVQVRKDLASVSSSGRPKVGYKTNELVSDLQKFFKRGNTDNAVVVGMGPLGHAIVQYEGFAAFGFNVVSAFDYDEKVIGRRCGELEILPMNLLYDFCNAGGVRLGVICVSPENAQDVCNTLVKSGSISIWNFSGITLEAQQDVVVYNENFTASLAVLASHIKCST